MIFKPLFQTSTTFYGSDIEIGFSQLSFEPLKTYPSAPFCKNGLVIPQNRAAKTINIISESSLVLNFLN